MRQALFLAALGLFPDAVLSEVPPTPSCSQALEQIATLKTLQPVYKLLGADQRNYIEDADRPAEIARLQRIVTASCPTEPKARAAEQAEADREHVALSPECAVERDKLAAMELPNSHESADAITGQRRLVADKCPAVDTHGLWLVQWLGRSDLQP